jgi:hypothetical protein
VSALSFQPHLTSGSQTQFSTTHLGPSPIRVRLTLRSDTKSAACNKDNDDISSTSLLIFASPRAGGRELLVELDGAASVLANLRRVLLDIDREDWWRVPKGRILLAMFLIVVVGADVFGNIYQHPLKKRDLGNFLTIKIYLR